MGTMHGIKHAASCTCARASILSLKIDDSILLGAFLKCHWANIKEKGDAIHYPGGKGGWSDVWS